MLHSFVGQAGHVAIAVEVGYFPLRCL